MAARKVADVMASVIFGTGSSQESEFNPVFSSEMRNHPSRTPDLLPIRRRGCVDLPALVQQIAERRGDSVDSATGA